KISSPQVVQRSLIDRESLRLSPNRFFPMESQPSEIIEDLLLKFRPASCPVDILDPQQRTPSGGFGQSFGEKRRVGVTKMQFTCGTGCEPGDNAGVHPLETSASSQPFETLPASK